jgi:hypothetical protein
VAFFDANQIVTNGSGGSHFAPVFEWMRMVQ